MKLKSFHESFRQDLQDPEFVIVYLQDCLEEGGTELFISALKDVVNVALLSPEIQRQQDDLFKDFIGTQNPTFFEVFQVLRFLELDFKLQLLIHKDSNAIGGIALA
jgi:DNA-binding phage protein